MPCASPPAPGSETDPAFSPDGNLIAFTGEYDGNVDVFVIPASGGVPRRLTWHPAPDRVVGWTPDGKHIIFASKSTAYLRYAEMFAVPVDGGVEEKLPLLTGYAHRCRRTGNPLPTSPSFVRSQCGSTTGAARPRASGWRAFPKAASRRYRGPIPTTSTPCGPATGYTSSPTAMVRP